MILPEALRPCNLVILLQCKLFILPQSFYPDLSIEDVEVLQSFLRIAQIVKKINIAGLLSESEDEASETDSNALSAGTDKISTSDQNIEYENGEEPLKLGDILDIQRSASPTTTIAPETEERTFLEYKPTGTNPTTTDTPMLETEETTFTTLTTDVNYRHSPRLG